MISGAPSLRNHMKRLAIRWAAFWIVLAIPFGGALFYAMQFTAAETQFATNARMITTLKRAQIFSGDINSAELQIRKDLDLGSSDKAVFLDENMRPWLQGARTVELKSCGSSKTACRDWINHKLVIYQPIYFDNRKESIWGYLYLEQTPGSNWGFAVVITAFFTVIMLLQNFGFYTNVVREISKVSTTLKLWADRLLKNPKGVSVDVSAPFSEIAPIERALSHLTDEIHVLENAARAEGALTTLRGVGHDILNPVSRIKRIIGMIRTDQKSALPIDEELLCSLQKNVKRLSDYAEQLKFIYKRDLGENVETRNAANVSSEVSNLLSELKFDPEAVDRNVEITSSIEDNCFASIPAAALGRMVENICSNGIQATSDRGSMHVSVKNSGDSVILDIVDSGCGIPVEAQSRIFEAGYSSKPNKGTGLGLFVVRQICDQYSGKIELHSKVGRGTSIRITLPRIEVSDVV